MDRVMVFIDGNNLYKSSQIILGPNPTIDYPLLAQCLIDPTKQKLVRTYYYSALSAPNDNPQKYQAHKAFLEQIKKHPRFEVITGFLQRKAFRSTNPPQYYHVEKETDVNIATDMLSLAYDDGYDLAILVSHDSDYLKVLQRVKARGKSVIVAVCQGGQAHKLREIADDVIEMDAQFFSYCVPVRVAAAPTTTSANSTPTDENL